MTKARRHANTEYAEKLDRLMTRYGIEGGDYLALALCLANDYVPGFTPAAFKKRHGDYGAVVRDTGRPIKWTVEERDALVSDIDNAKKQFDLSTDQAALEYLTKSGKWACPVNRERHQWMKTLKNLVIAHRKTQRRVIKRHP